MIEFNYLKYKKTNFNIDKAKKVYKQLCKHAKARKWQDDLYGEIHHIKPRSLGGSDSKRNLVKLTFPEHCFAHYLLAIIYPKSNLICAFIYMTNALVNNHDNLIKEVDFSEFKHLEKVKANAMKGRAKNASKEIKAYLSTKEGYKQRCEQLETVRSSKKFRKVKSEQFSEMNDKMWNSNEIYKDGLTYREYKTKKQREFANMHFVKRCSNCGKLNYNVKISTKKCIYCEKDRILIQVDQFRTVNQMYEKYPYSKILKRQKDKIKKLLENNRLTITQICEKLKISREYFDRYFYEDFKNNTNILLESQTLYSLKIDNIKLLNKTKRELKDYVKNNNIQSFVYNDKLYNPLYIIDSLKDELVSVKSSVESYRIREKAILYDLTINGKKYIDKTKKEVFGLLTKYSKKILYVNGNKHTVNNFIARISIFWKKYKKFEIKI